MYRKAAFMFELVFYRGMIATGGPAIFRQNVRLSLFLQT